MLWKVTEFLIASTIGLLIVLPQLWMMGFFGDYSVVLITVDRSPEWHHPPCIGSSPLINNLFFISLFVLPHSAMIRGPMKKLLVSFFPEQYYRQLYALVSAIILTCTLYFWQPMLTVVWEVTNETLIWVITGLNGAAWIGLLCSLLNLDALALFGVKDPLYRLMEWKEQPPKLVDTGIYGIVRHPVYSALMLGYWIAPKMTVGHLLLSATLTGYIVFATVCYEEPQLMRTFGDSYVKYKKKTSMFFPIPFPSFSATNGGTKKD